MLAVWMLTSVFLTRAALCAVIATPISGSYVVVDAVVWLWCSGMCRWRCSRARQMRQLLNRCICPFMHVPCSRRSVCVYPHRLPPCTVEIVACQFSGTQRPADDTGRVRRVQGRGGAVPVPGRGRHDAQVPALCQRKGSQPCVDTRRRSRGRPTTYLYSVRRDTTAQLWIYLPACLCVRPLLPACLSCRHCAGSSVVGVRVCCLWSRVGVPSNQCFCAW